jgi:pimeloyl-ACP methyl ester carboxylesterase
MNSVLPTLMVALVLICAGTARAADPVALEELRVPSTEAGLSLYLRHRAPVPKKQGAKDSALEPAAQQRQVVLLVHGAFFPASAAFDVNLPGGSVLRELAARGLSAYTLDVRGYGGSTRPAFMSRPIGPYQAFATTRDAILDVASAVELIRQREGVEAVAVLGWSWGAAIAGGFAERHPERVSKLILFAPGWLAAEPAPLTEFGSYRTFDHDAARARVLNGVPEARVEEIHPSAWFERFWALNLGLDREGSSRHPAVVRAPSGVSQDFVDYWRQGKPTWDPGQVRAATLVIVGEWDRNTPPDMARKIHAGLTRAAARELVVLPEATHFAVLEKSRSQWIDAVARFILKP